VLAGVRGVEMGHGDPGDIDDANVTVVAVVRLEAHRPESDGRDGGSECRTTCESFEHSTDPLKRRAPLRSTGVSPMGEPRREDGAIIRRNAPAAASLGAVTGLH